MHGLWEFTDNFFFRIVCMLQLIFFISDNFYFSFVFEYGSVCLWSWNKGKIKITWDKKKWLQHLHGWAIAFNIPPPPPSWLRTYLWRLKKIAFSPEEFHKIWAYSLKNLCLLLCVPLKNFVKIEASTPKEILNFYNLHQRNSIGPHPGEGGTWIKYNSPLCICVTSLFTAIFGND